MPTPSTNSSMLTLRSRLQSPTDDAGAGYRDRVLRVGESFACGTRRVGIEKAESIGIGHRIGREEQRYLNVPNTRRHSKALVASSRTPSRCQP
jgi:hypothetical protein